jgi:hypothetical protein
MAVTAEPWTQIVLLAGCAVALLVAVFGRRVKNNEQEFKMAVRLMSGIAGVIMLIWTFVLVTEGGWDFGWMLLFLVLGVGLLFPLLPRVNLGTILALIIAALIAFALADSMDVLWVVLVFLIIFFVLWFVLGIVFRAVRGVGAVLGSRIVLMVVGVLGAAVALFSLLD